MNRALVPQPLELFLVKINGPAHEKAFNTGGKMGQHFADYILKCIYSLE